MTNALSVDVQRELSRLMHHYGPQNWWPAESAYEMALGAVLVQNAAWRNAELALANLRRAALLDPRLLSQQSKSDLQQLLRPSGTYRIKTDRVLALTHWWNQCAGSVTDWSDNVLLERLRQIPGIGPETADCIALYGFQRPVFIADAYARRWLCRMGLLSGQNSYASAQAQLHQLEADARWMGEAHAVVVEHCKQFCVAQPRCQDCCCHATCEYRREHASEPN